MRSPRSLRALRAGRVLAAGLAFALALWAVPLAEPSPAVGIGPLPACRIDDILTIPRGYDDWQHTLVDWTLSVGPKYKPPDLVSVRDSGIAGGGYVRKVAIDGLAALAAAAKKNGTPLVAWSPYRTYKTQAELFNNGVKAYGYDSAITYWGRPGHSEHQLGTTIDFVAVGDHSLTSNWEVTKTGGWMATHAWEYGWVMSYPKGKQDLVCYHYEPWHYRFYGRELAAKIHDSGLTPREYLWANFTQVDPETGLPLATPTAVPTTTPAPSPTVLPTPSLGPIPTTAAAASQPPTSPTTETTGSVGTLATLVIIAVAGLAAVGAGLWFGLRRRTMRR